MWLPPSATPDVLATPLLLVLAALGAELGRALGLEARDVRHLRGSARSAASVLLLRPGRRVEHVHHGAADATRADEDTDGEADTTEEVHVDLPVQQDLRDQGEGDRDDRD